jgi:YHS domain-containing protein
MKQKWGVDMKTKRQGATGHDTYHKGDETGLNELEGPALIDPVCRMEVNATSPHNCAHGGAMIFFCSDRCREHFKADPVHFVNISMPEHDGSTLSLGPVLMKAPEEPERPVVVEQNNKESSVEVEKRLNRGVIRGLITSWFLAWREGRHVSRTSRELLALYRSVSAVHPKLAGRELYKQVVMERNSCDSTAADAVLECAEESFSEWPVRRELTLCDVVHYLTITEFLALHDGEHWLRSDTRLLVASRIPRNLCILRKK